MGPLEKRRFCSGSSCTLRFEKGDDEKTDLKRQRLERGKRKKKPLYVQCGWKWAGGSLASGTALHINTV